MIRRSNSRSAVLAALVAAAVSAPASRAQDPPGRDDPRAAAEIADLAARDRKSREAAMAALTKRGAAVVPQLMRELHPAAGGPARERLVGVVRVLGRIGAPAAPAVAPMLKLVPSDDTNLSRDVVLALGRIGPYARRQARAIRNAMIEVLLANPMARAMDAPISAFFTNTSGATLDTLRTYSRTLLDPDGSVEALAAGLAHDNPFVREYATELLARRGESAPEAIDALLPAVTAEHPKTVVCREQDAGDPDALQFEFDLDRRIRHWAASALCQQAPDDPRTVPAHLLLLEQPDPAQRRTSAMALGRIGREAKAAVPLLCKLLGSDVADVRAEAATALGMIEIDTPEVREALGRAAQDRDKAVVQRARAALQRLDGQ